MFALRGVATTPLFHGPSADSIDQAEEKEEEKEEKEEEEEEEEKPAHDDDEEKRSFISSRSNRLT